MEKIQTEIRLGLKENWRQFLLLVIINGFVGGMIGMERSLLPAIASEEFKIVAKTAVLSFIASFGITKAFTNYFGGLLANRWGRKKLLVMGWWIAVPVPFLLMYGNNWNWVLFANVLLGISQGLTWSSTVVMKIDLVGEKRRGLAMGLNESAGYLSLAITAFLTGWIASHYGLRPYPFVIGIVLSITGLLSSIFLVKDTRHHLQQESSVSKISRLNSIFWDTSWKKPNLGAVTQAGLINNLNDGMIWGLLPIILAGKGMNFTEIGLIAAIYPAIWGVGQLVTGILADRYPKKKLLVWGMALQGVALLTLIQASSKPTFILISIALGWGTAMVYPTFLATVAENTHPKDRAESIGVFRLWRDLGYAIGAIVTGILADLMNLEAAVIFIGLLTLLSAWIIRKRMRP